MERFPDHGRGYEEIREIPRGQRFLGRPKLEKLWGAGMAGDRGKRNERYSQR